MEIEQIGGDKPNFGLVGLMAATALLVIIIAAAMIVGWRARHVKKVPYEKHPTSQITEPLRSLQAA